MRLDATPRARAVRSFDSVQRNGPSQWQFGWYFAAGDPAFAGHFPQRPILPGVFLLEMAQRAVEWALRESLGGNWHVGRILRLRFVAPVQPGEDCTLHVNWECEPADGMLSVCVNFSREGITVAHGLLCAVLDSRDRKAA